ncbi:aspartyl/asparaginyl beta-hydroxylase domain-containing protein [Paraburkholderia sp. SIMBA_050]
MRLAFLFLFFLCASFTHWRGKVRHGSFFRQLTDHSTFTAPLNCFAYLFSSVPNTPYISPQLLPELALLKREWRVFREEALALVEASRIRAASTYNDVGFNSFFRTGWKRFYLKWYGSPHPSAQALCPRTVEILQRIPSVKAAMFAMLPAGGSLNPHRDPYAGSLRYHLGLMTPNDDRCAIVVDGIPYSWRDGEDVVFDETYLHHAENRTGEDRIILFCDVERPMKFAWAQAIIRAIGDVLLRAAASPNDVGDRTGGINRLFRYVYSVRLLGKRIKAWNRIAYYAIKWCLGAAIVIAIIW